MLGHKYQKFAVFAVLVMTLLYFYVQGNPQEPWRKNFSLLLGERQVLRDWEYVTQKGWGEHADRFPFALQSERMTCTLPQHPKVKDGQEVIFMRTKIPDDWHERDWLFFKSTDQSFCMWIDNKPFYAYGSMEKGDHFRGRSWHLVQLPVGYRGKELAIKAYSEEALYLGVFEFMNIGAQREQILRLFLYDLPYLAGIPVAIVLMAIMLSYLRQTKRRKIFFWIMLYSLNYILWAIGMMNTSLLFWNAPLFLWMLHLLTAYAMPILATLFIRDIVEERYQKPLLWIIFFYTTLFFGGVFAEIFLKGYYLQSIDAIFYPSLLLTSPYVYYTLQQSKRAGNEDATQMCWTYGFSVLLGIVDGVNLQMHLSETDILFSAFAIWSMIPFAMHLIRSDVKQERVLRARAEELHQEMVEVQMKSERDALTGCYNRYRFDKRYEQFVDIARSTKAPLSCIMLDIDFFKCVNDRYGHDEGDVVLKNFVAVLKEVLTRQHMLFRWGGEEFIILTLHMNLKEAAEFADTLRRLVEQSKICRQQCITCSIGVSAWRIDDTADKLVKRADEALYRAKNSGRNKVLTEENT